MTPLPLSERLERLTSPQRYLLDRCRAAQLEKDRAAEEWRTLLTQLVEGGFTYGMLSSELGVSREAIFRIVERHRQRMGVDKVVERGIMEENAG